MESSGFKLTSEMIVDGNFYVAYDAHYYKASSM